MQSPGEGGRGGRGGAHLGEAGVGAVVVLVVVLVAVVVALVVALVAAHGLRLRAARQREEADDGGEERHPAAWRLLT